MSYLVMILVCLISASGTHSLSHQKKMGPIRASALLTLFFVALTAFLPVNVLIPKLRAAFFGASFVGMSDISRLCRKRVIYAAIVFGVLFCFLSQLKSTIGGTLGATAFISCLIVFYLTQSNRKSSEVNEPL